MDFGLGLVLSFTDNASAGINNAVNSLTQLTQTAEGASASLNEMASLSALSVVSNQLGTAFTSAGSAILGIFGTLIGETQKTGSEFENFRVTLNALYGDTQRAESAISQLLDFSIKSPFEVGEVKDMLVVLQSQGVDAFSNITGGISGARQETLSWIADLMAFKPDEATSRWKRALTNYLGSGEDRMLRNILDMGDIDQILGHDVGATVEERLNDIIEIVEKKNLTGLAENLSHTWQGVQSNIQDAFTKIYKSVADNGVFDNLKSSFMNLSGAILMLDNTQLEALGKTIAGGLNIIIAPLTFVANKLNSLIMSIVDLCQTNPELVKLGMVFVAIVGALLLLVGVVLKVTSAFSGLTLMYMAFGSSFKAIGTFLITKSKMMIAKILPLIATLGLLYLAWKTNFLGIRTIVTGFVSNLTSSFREAKTAVNGSVRDVVETLGENLQKKDFFSKLTIGLMRTQILFRALSEAWNGNTLSADTMHKAEALGIKPLIESILKLKYRFEEFKDGFIQGWNDINNKIGEAIKNTFDIEPINGFFEGAKNLFESLSSADPQAWKDFGNTLGEVTAVIVPLVAGVYVAYKAILAIVGIVKLGIGIFKGLFTVIKVVGGFLTSVFGTVVSVVAGVIMAVSSFIDMFKHGFSQIKEIIMVVGIALATIGAIILGAPAFIAGVIGAIVAAVATLVILIKDNWQAIKDCISTFCESIKATTEAIFNGIASFFSTVLSTIFNTIVSILTAIVSFFVFIFGGIRDVVSGALEWIGTRVTNGLNAVKSTFTSILSAVANTVSSKFNAVKNKISEIIENAKSVVSNGLNAIKGFFDNLTLKLPHIPLPHFEITGSLSLNPPSVPHLSVEWYERGGVFNKPSLIGVGENGEEAVMPLERNTGWIGKLAGLINSEMRNDSNLTPTSTRQYNTENQGDSNYKYYTTNNSETKTEQYDVDNSITFNEGAIQLNVQNATEEEAIRLAKKIMEYIKRQRELDKMLAYS